MGFGVYRVLGFFFFFLGGGGFGGFAVQGLGIAVCSFRAGAGVLLFAKVLAAGDCEKWEDGNLEIQSCRDKVFGLGFRV